MKLTVKLTAVTLLAVAGPVYAQEEREFTPQCQPGEWESVAEVEGARKLAARLAESLRGAYDLMFELAPVTARRESMIEASRHIVHRTVTMDLVETTAIILIERGAAPATVEAGARAVAESSPVALVRGYSFSDLAAIHVRCLVPRDAA